MPKYSYADSLTHSYRVNWKISDVLGTKRFDTAKTWMPAGLSGAPAVTFLDEAGKRALTQVELAAYAHLFAYTEEFIAPTVGALAKDHAIDRRDAFDALTNFAAEEVKHMNLFRQIRARVDEVLGFQLALVPGEADTAKFVLSKHTGAVLMLTSCIEWMTQRHYLDAFDGESNLDPLVKGIFKAHWQEESQHAQLDHLETVRVYESMTETERDCAIGDLIDLVAGVHALLVQQTELDVANLSTLLDRTFTPPQLAELRKAILQSKRWTFILSGVTHPRFQELFTALTTPAQRARVEKALHELMNSEPAVVAV